MRIIYGLIYYYLLGVVAACLLLVVLVPRFARRLFFSFWDRIPMNATVKYLFYCIILLNCLVLVDSASTYIQYQNILGARTPWLTPRED